MRGLVAIALIASSAGTAWGANCTTSSTGNWGTAGIWSCGHVPGSTGHTGDTVVINSPGAVTLNVAATVAGVSITYVSGNNTASLDAANQNLTVNGALTLSAGTNNRRTASLSIGTGNVIVTGNVAAAGTAANDLITFNGAGTLQVGGSLSGGMGFTAGPGNGTVSYIGTVAQTVTSYPYNSLTINNPAGATLAAATTLTGNLAIAQGSLTDGGNQLTGSAAGTLTMASGTTLQLGSGTAATSFPSLYTTANISLATTSTVVYAANAAQTISATPSYGKLTLSATAAVTKTASAGLTAHGDVTVGANNTLALAAGATNTFSANLLNNGVINANSTQTNLAGNFTDNGTYTAATGHTLNLNGTTTQTLGGTASTTFNNLTLNNANGATLAGSRTVNGTLTLTSGTLAVGANTLTLNGPTIAGTPINLSTTAASSLVFGGTATGVNVPLSVVLLNALTVSNTNGVTLNSSPTVASLALSGPISAGSNRLTVTGTCPGAVSQSGNGFVDGSLRLTFPSTSQTCLFPLGTVSGTTFAYAPINFTAPAGGGTLTAATIGQEHPQIANSDLSPSRDANRYWTLWQSGDMTPSTYGATFNFTSGDLDAAATPTSFVLDRYDGSTWLKPTPVSATATSVTASSIPGPLNAPVSFAVGEAAPTCPVPSYLPAGMSCQCDNFTRTTVNPSTIFGGDYTLSQSSGNTGWPKIATQGYLQMTDNSNNMATSATVPGTFPGSGNLITIEFKHYAYGGTGADGMAITLSDATINPVPGAYGGSLGYAQKTQPTNIPGFTGGWIGVALDEFGNYSNPTEGRVGGPGPIPNAAAVRGSGSGQTGYPYLGGTTTLSPGVWTNSAIRGPGYSYRITVDARCYQSNASGCNNPGLAKKTLVSVDRDTSGGTNYSTLIPAFDAYTANASQADVPANWKLSFAGSTGSNTDIHELAGLKICAANVTPPAGYQIQIDNLSPSTCATPGGTPSSPIVTVTAKDSNGNVVPTYTGTVTLSAVLSGGGASGATWRKVGAASDLAGNQYTFTAADAGTAQFYLTDTSSQTVYITVTDSAASLSSSASSPVAFSGGGSFNIVNSDALGGNAGGGVVAGRNHLFRVTKLNCAAGSPTTDTAYTGSKSLDGWYSPAAAHPSTAVAPLLCTTNAGNSCLPSTGACSPLSIAEPTVNGTSNFMPAINFSSGVANVCLSTSDVGKYSFSLRDDTTASVIRGASQTLTARPFAITVSGVKSGSTNNPATDTNTNPASPYNVSAPQNAPAFIKAGASFEATIGGYLWNSAADSNADGLPDSGVGFSTVNSAGLAPSYADSVTLSAASPFVPSGGVLGTMSGVASVSGGQGHPTALSYSEVGSFSLTAQPSTAYLSTTGVNLTSRTLLYTNPSSNAQNAWIGRFYPDHFAVSNGSIRNRADLSCAPASTFTYMGEPIAAQFRLTAQNAGNGTTLNYTGTYARLALTPASVFAFGGVDTTAPGTALTARLDTSAAASGSWLSGAADVTAPVTVLRRTSAPLEDGPYENFFLGIRPVDADGVTVLTSALNLDTNLDAVADTVQIGSATKVRFGRLTMTNAYGSEFLKLPIPFGVQYWGGTNGFVVNRDDSCTPIPTGSLTMTQYGQNLNACETAVSSAFTLVNGAGALTLAAPGAGNNGSVNLTLNLGSSVSGNVCTAVGAAPGAATVAPTPTMTYLQGKWSGTTYSVNPTAKATFGVYKSGPVIYMREVH